MAGNIEAKVDPARLPGCDMRDVFYGTVLSAERLRLDPIPAPLSMFPPVASGMETVPVPCIPCDAERKDRSFVRGTAYTGQSTRLLVDHASASAGAKIVSYSPGMRGVNDILVSDDNKYLLTVCSAVWFTIRLADEVFVEKIGLVASELFASTFRHLQILGSRNLPTTEWRILGEIETNPMENQELFDIGASSECNKCYVKYIKVRVLTHHALEGYTNCALTRFQVFGSTVLQSLDKIRQETPPAGSRLPTFVRTSVHTLAELMEERISQLNGVPYVAPPAAEIEPVITVDPPTTDEEERNPLLKFVEEMALLKKQYAMVANTLQTINDRVVPAQTTNSTEASPTENVLPETIDSTLGTQIPSFATCSNFIVALLACIQVWMLVTTNKQPVPMQKTKKTHALRKIRIRRSLFSIYTKGRALPGAEMQIKVEQEEEEEIEKKDIGPENPDFSFDKAERIDLTSPQKPQDSDRLN